jgi:hypothetical protein
MAAILTQDGKPAIGGVFHASRKLNLEIHDLFVVLAGLHLECVNRTANQHASGDHQRQGDGNLDGHEGITESATAERGGSRVGVECGKSRPIAHRLVSLHEWDTGKFSVETHSRLF